MKRLLIILLLFTSCATIRVKDNGRDFVNVKAPKPKYPQNTGRVFIGGKVYPNPQVWVTRRGRYFYYKEKSWPIRNRKVFLKVKK